MQKFKLIIVSPLGFSGSNLMHSLLDSHEQILTLPTRLFKYPDKEKILTSKVVERFIELHKEIFDNRFRQNLPLLERSNKNSELISLDTFKEKIKILLKNEWNKVFKRKQFIEAIHLAYAQASGLSLADKEYILIHLHHYDGSHIKALEDYPDLKVIVMIRDPRESWLSFKTRNLKNEGSIHKIFNFVNLHTHIYDLKNDFEKLIQFSNLIKLNQICLVDLNKLHALQEKGMIAISKFLEIRYNNSLLESSFLGIPWLGNAADGKSINGLSIAKSKFKWQENINQSELNVIYGLMKKEFIFLNYSIINQNFSILKQFKVPFIFIQIAFFRGFINSLFYLKCSFKTNKNLHKNKPKFFIFYYFLNIKSFLKSLIRFFKVFFNKYFYYKKLSFTIYERLQINLNVLFLEDILND